MEHLKLLFITKAGSSPFEYITSIGGRLGNSNWEHSTIEAIYYIENHVNIYYAPIGNGVKVVVATDAKGNKSLTTAQNKYEENLLLSLPEKPKKFELFGRCMVSCEAELVPLVLMDPGVDGALADAYYFCDFFLCSAAIHVELLGFVFFVHLTRIYMISGFVGLFV